MSIQKADILCKKFKEELEAFQRNGIDAQSLMLAVLAFFEKVDRDEFEALYVAQARADGVPVTITSMATLRRGDKYPDKLMYLNGAWAGYQLAIKGQTK